MAMAQSTDQGLWWLLVVMSLTGEEELRLAWAQKELWAITRGVWGRPRDKLGQLTKNWNQRQG